MKHAIIDNGMVMQIIPDEDPRFPGVPITERFSAEILEGAVELADSDDTVRPGMIYSPENGFSWPEPQQEQEPEPAEPDTGQYITYDELEEMYQEGVQQA